MVTIELFWIATRDSEIIETAKLFSTATGVRALLPLPSGPLLTGGSDR